MKEIIKSFGINNICIYLIAINIVGFLAMGIDKW